MSRSDQFVGLTKKGNEFIAKLKKRYPEKRVNIGFWAFDPGKITGSKFELKERIYQEEIQCSPWSSGPVYLTRIAIYNKKTKKKIGTMFDWIEDPNVKGEVDIDNGKFYI